MKKAKEKNKWASFKVTHSNPITFATIIKRINDISKKDSENETINLISHLNYKIKKIKSRFYRKRHHFNFGFFNNSLYATRS